MQKIFNFFPLTVYKSTLSLSENEKNEMIEEVRLMEKKSKNLDYKSETKAWTGDTQGFEYLHNNPKFKNLFIQINNCILEYLESLSGTIKSLIFIFRDRGQQFQKKLNILIIIHMISRIFLLHFI